MRLRLSVVTPTREVLALECDEVVAPGASGEVGLLPGHLPLITALKPGVLTLSQGGRRRHFAVGAGFAEVDANRVSVLTEACEESHEIDRDRAADALRRASSRLASLAAEDPTHFEESRRAARAQARLDACDRH